MQRTNTVVIGAGQAGLATSHRLTAAGRDHVVLERGLVAERWRSERWDSLRLLTPNWMTRLPGWSYTGPDPDGFMAATEVIAFFEGYARSFAPPVVEGVTVESVEPVSDGYRVRTDTGSWRAANVVVATGAGGRPRVPAAAAGLHPGLHQVASNRYRNPEALPPGGVLVVGASATGVQIAAELARSGRPVVLAVGEHTRLPRRYRGRDVFWWLDRAGVLAETIDGHPDPEAARRTPSLQLLGTADGTEVDLAACRAAGVRLAGRFVGADGTRVRFAGDLAARVARSERRRVRTLDRFERWATAAGLGHDVQTDDRTDDLAGPHGVADEPLDLDLRAAGITTVVWATGFAPHHPWLHVPVLDATGGLRHHRGVTPAPGLYVVGQRFQHRRDSSFIDGVGHDARFVVDHLTARPADRAAGLPPVRRHRPRRPAPHPEPIP
jgi:putative flavoprotein involved in K+ transport